MKPLPAPLVKTIWCSWEFPATRVKKNAKPEAAESEKGNSFRATGVLEAMRPVLETTFQDIGYAIRVFKRNPLFAVTAILTAALGIGGATAVFSAVDRVLFRPLPYVDSNRLVSFGMMTPLDTNEFVFPGWY